MPAAYLTPAQIASDPSRGNASAAGAIENASALNTLYNQQTHQNDLERAYRRDWWKRGLAKGALGAVTGAISGIAGGPGGIAAGAGAGLGGGFGGEALNHAAFKDQNGAIGDAGAALGALGGRAAGSYLSSGGSGFGGAGGEAQAALASGDISSDDYQAYMRQLSGLRPGQR